MRERKEIENEFEGLFSGSMETRLILESILDVRDLLWEKKKPENDTRERMEKLMK